MMKRYFAWATSTFVLAAVGIQGCATGEDDSNTTTVTFYQDIAPLFADKCVSCHRDGGIAPFALDNLEDARTFGSAAKAATASRQMPPYLAVADGSCGDFEEPRALSDEQIQMIADWVDGDMLAGEKEDIPKPRALPTLEGDAITFHTPEFTPEIAGDDYAKFDEYRCFLLDPKLDEDTFLTGYEVTPGNDAIVHHVVVFSVPMDGESDYGDGTTNAEVIQALDDESPDRDGWPCFGAAGDGVSLEGVPATWAPGQGAVKYPHEAGMQFPVGTKLVAQVHYNLVDEKTRGQKDSTTIKFSVAEQVKRVAFFDLPDDLLDSLFEGDPILIPPGEKNWEFTFDIDYDDFIEALGGLDISGFFPHMHERGRTLRFEIVRDDEEMCQGYVPDWDFNWQLFYFYEKPVPLEKGDKLRVTCGFNTEGMDEPVLPGWGTYNEMCLSGLMLSVPAQ